MTKPKVCLNPSCGLEFNPGHYGALQRVCSGSYEAKCKRCQGRDCRRCRGKGKYQSTCRAWYRTYWSQTRKPPRGIAPEDLRRILKAFEPEVLWWSLFTVAAHSALRKGELLGLTWGDVLSGSGGIRPTIELRGQWSDQQGFQATKTDAGRIAFLLGPARPALARYLKDASRVKGFEASDRIWPVSEVKAWQRFVDIQKKLRIKNPDTGRPHRVHDLRHTAIGAVYQATNDLGRAQVLAGHRNPATTAIYSQRRPEDFAADLEKKMFGSK